jgi:cytochrome c5
VGNCIACHTNTPAHGLPFVGGFNIHTPVGDYISANITPDVATGIGSWSADDFINAMHRGINPDGQYLFPVFPYTSFTKIDKDDLMAIQAYLGAIPPVYQVNQPPQARWPFNWRPLQRLWRLAFFRQGYYHYDLNHSTQWNRGAYLVQGIGHCGQCHTPRNRFGALLDQYYLSGAVVAGQKVPAIAGVAFTDTPLGMVSDSFDKQILLDKSAPVRGALSAVKHRSLAYLTFYDLNAIALYLRTLPMHAPVPTATAKPSTDISIAHGKQIYDRYCASCHNNGYKEAPILGNKADWQPLLAKNVDTLIHNTLQGVGNMPPKGGCKRCSNADVIAAVKYMVQTANPQGDYSLW